MCAGVCVRVCMCVCACVCVSVCVPDYDETHNSCKDPHTSFDDRGRWRRSIGAQWDAAEKLQRQWLLLGSGLASHSSTAQGLVIAADHPHNLEEARVPQSPLGEKIDLHHFPMTSK